MEAIDIIKIASSEAIEIKPEDIESDTENLPEEPENPPLTDHTSVNIKSNDPPSKAVEETDRENLKKIQNLPSQSLGSSEITSNIPQNSLIQLNNDQCEDSNEDSSEDEEEFRYECNTVNEAVEMVQISKNMDGIENEFEVKGTRIIGDNIQSQKICTIKPLTELTAVNKMTCGNSQINQTSVPQSTTNLNGNKEDQSLPVNSVRYFSQRRVYTEEILEVIKIKGMEYVCVYCRYASTNRQHLIYHIRFAHRDKGVLENIKRKKRKQCPQCPAQTTDLTVHILNNHTNPEDIDWLYCGHCDHKTKLKKALEFHIITKHCDRRLYQDFEPFNCPECDKKYFSIGLLNKHIQSTHHRGTMKELKCDSCDFTTIRRDTLSKHKRRHANPVEGFKCPKCEFRGKTNRDLIRHQQNEHQQWFQCHVCPYRCHLQNVFNMHLIHHKENKKENLNLKCEKCDYKTYRPNNLLVHMLNHKKPEELEMFQCYHCGLKAKRKDNLKAHIFRHDIYKSILSCFVCDFKTRSKHELKKHVDTHSEEQRKEAKSKKAPVYIKQVGIITAKRKYAKTISAKRKQTNTSAERQQPEAVSAKRKRTKTPTERKQPEDVSAERKQAETLSADRKQPEAISVKREQPEDVFAERKEAETSAERKQPEDVSAERKQAETLSAERKQPEAISVKRKQPEDVFAEKKEAETSAERKQPEDVSAERKQAETLSAERKQPEAISVKREQPEDVFAERKEAETSAERKQPEVVPAERKQAKTRSAKRKQTETSAEYKQAETISDGSKQVEMVKERVLIVKIEKYKI